MNTVVKAAEESGGADQLVFIWKLVATSLETTLSLVVQIMIGVIMSNPKIGLLPQSVVGGLSKILLKALLPILVLYKSATAIDFSLLKDALVAPIAGLTVTALQFIIAEILFFDWKRVFGKKKVVKKGEKIFPSNIVKLTIMFNNYLIIPYAYLSALTEGNIFKDPKRGDHAMAFVTLYYFPVMMLFFTFGFYYAETDPSRPKVEEKPKAEAKTTKEKLKRIWGVILVVLKKFFPPCILAIVIGLFFGINPPLKNFFFQNPPPIVGVFAGVLKKFGASAIPVAMLITGGNVGFILWKIFYPEVFAQPTPTEIEMKDKDEIGVLDDLLESEVEEEPVEKEVSTEKKKKKGNFIKDFIKKYWIIRYNSLYTCFASVFGKLILSPLIVFIVLAIVSVLWPQIIMTNQTMAVIMYLVIAIESSCPVTPSLNMLASAYQCGIEEVAELLLLQTCVAPITLVVFCIGYLYFFCWVTTPYGCNI